MMIHLANRNDMNYIISYAIKQDCLVSIMFNDGGMIRRYFLDKEGFCVSQSFIIDRETGEYKQINDDYYLLSNGSKIHYIPVVFYDNNKNTEPPLSCLKELMAAYFIDNCNEDK